MGKVADAAELYRASGRSPAMRERLAAAIRSAVSDAVARVGRAIPTADQKDVAQETTLKVLTAIETGCARTGTEDGFARACAFTGVKDWFRRRPPEVSAPDDDPDGPMGTNPPPSAERQMQLSELAELTLKILKAAPENYRIAVTHVDWRDGDIDDLVQKELRERIPHPPSAEEIKQARATVYAWLSRGRAWVRARLAEDHDITAVH
jgi:DNA-directed RNA polymerase specialized sigma24 family protein